MLVSYYRACLAAPDHEQGVPDHEQGVRVYRWTDLSQVPAEFGPSVVTIGNFDGVHRGHQSVLRRMVADASEMGASAVVVTFDPHPSTVHRPEKAPDLITGIRDRLELLQETGIAAVLTQHYTLEFAHQSPEQFVQHYLVEGLNAAVVVVGRDVRFGWGNSGDLDTMLELGERFDFRVDVIDDVNPLHDPAGAYRRWSSTWVREHLTAGEVEDATQILGRPHRMRGVVVRGEARGRELGFPTANLAQNSTGMVPADGVYAGWLSSPAEQHMPAAISIGTNPTFAGEERRVEAHVLDRTDLDLYDQEIVVEFADRIRPTLKFDSIDELIATMTEDVEHVRAALTAHPPQRR
jgi:riboflavin kinase/FMN adenylyltransferase